MDHISGFVAIIGLPNVGKSTFLNYILKQKISIVSSKPQTTRNKILGILTEDNAQIIFIDTPGVYKPKHELGRRMHKSALSAPKGVDAIIMMTDATYPSLEKETALLEELKRYKLPLYLVINKIDLLKGRIPVDKVIMAYKDLADFAGIFPISALNGQNVGQLLSDIKGILPIGPAYYPKEMVTDHPERFIIAEFIREKILYFTKEEVPHSVAVVIETLRPNEKLPNLVDCLATIYVERQSQKGILIGEGGKMLKKISTLARKDIENLLGSRVYLEVWVKVSEDWRNKNSLLKSMGYGIDNF